MMDQHTADSVVSDATTDSQRVLKRHRIRHTKSRNGCYPCKSRRVKCDELQPACGTCSSRGEPCSYPSPRIPSKRPPRVQRKETSHDNGFLIPGSFAPWHGGPPLDLTRPLEFDATLPAISLSQHDHGHGSLAMEDLKLLQFFHLYTARQMSLHPRRSMIWQRVIPEFGNKSQYLMHLLLALGGIHMITQQAEASRSGVFDHSDTVDLATVVEHHQRGLEGFREEVSCISPSNAELVFTGSLLLVGFAFASLKVQELSPPRMAPEEMNRATRHSSSTNDILRLNWLYLNRGVSSVLHDQWNVLKASRLRQMLIYSDGNELYKDLPFDAPSSRLSRCSPRLSKFAEGASEAVANIKASLLAFELAQDDLSSHSSTRASQPSPSISIDLVVDECSGALEILDSVYFRILSVLRCAATESPADKEIQLDLEEATILSWPVLLPSTFLASLERSEHNPLHGHSLVILAHFYLVNTLIDSWFLRGSFEREILKINALIDTQNENQLSKFMLWPIEVMNLPPTCTL